MYRGVFSSDHKLMLTIYPSKSYSFKIDDKIKQMSKNWPYIFIIILFSLLGMKALFFPGLFTAHDIWHQVVRFYYYSQAIIDGQFPPYWISKLGNGFGYPLFIFSYHLPWMIGVLLLNIGFNLFDSIKILFFLSYILSGLTMYFFVLTLLKNRLAALTSSILYLWLPYHFLIIFVGASMGIAFVFIFLPLIFLGINLIGKRSELGIPILSIALSGIILSHIMHLIFLSPLILILTLYEFISCKDKANFLKNLFLGLVLTVLISAFYLLPAFFYSNSTKLYTENGFSELYKRNFINFKQLIYSKWGVAPIVNNAKNAEISFQLGITQWLSIALLITTIFINVVYTTKKLSKTYLKLSTLLLSTFVIYIILMLDFSKPIWALLVRVISLDFPFRLLLPASFIASVCAGVVIANFQKRFKILFSIFLILIASYTNRNHLRVNMHTNYPISTYLDSQLSVTTNTFNEYLPINANPRLLQKPWNEAVGENLSSLNTKQTTNSLSFDVNLTKDQKVSVGQFHFPGQTVYLDSKISQFDIDSEGRISLIVSKGQHNIIVRYQQTLLIKLSKILTAMGISLVLFLLFKERLHKKLAFD